MPLLQIRDFPDEMYRDLKEAAREDNRSVPQETIAIVRGYLYGGSRDAAGATGVSNNGRRRRALQRLADAFKGDSSLFVDAFDPVALIRQGREYERTTQVATDVAAEATALGQKS